MVRNHLHAVGEHKLVQAENTQQEMLCAVKYKYVSYNRRSGANLKMLLLLFWQKRDCSISSSALKRLQDIHTLKEFHNCKQTSGVEYIDYQHD